MTRMNPLRRLAATAALVGVTGFGAVALAAPAMADPGGSVAAPSDMAVATVELPSLQPMTVGDLMGSLNKARGMAIQSPVPTVPVVIDIARFTLTYTPQAAQVAQTVIANFYSALGYQVGFSKLTGALAIGDKICDPAKSASFNKGCVDPATDSRF